MSGISKSQINKLAYRMTYCLDGKRQGNLVAWDEVRKILTGFVKRGLLTEARFAAMWKRYPLSVKGASP